MSTLTKVLIVLLTLFSLFACGAVLIHVGSANNYRAVADEKEAIVGRCEKHSIIEPSFDKVR